MDARPVACNSRWGDGADDTIGIPPMKESTVPKPFSARAGASLAHLVKGVARTTFRTRARLEMGADVGPLVSARGSVQPAIPVGQTANLKGRIVPLGVLGVSGP